MLKDNRLETLAAFGILAGFLYHYYFLYLSPSFHQGALLPRYEAVFEGRAFAPWQYRVLVPWLVVELTRSGLFSLRHAVLLVEAVSLLAGFWFTLQAARFSGRAAPAVGVALYILFWGYGALFYPKPETFAAFLAVSAGAVLFLQTGGKRWSLLLAPLAAVLALTRIEILFAFGVPYFFRWLRDRRSLDAVCAAGIAASAAVTLSFLRRLYPAPYPPHCPPLQIAHNLTSPSALLLPLLFFAPAVLGVAAGLRGKTWKQALSSDLHLLLLWPAAHLVFCLFLARLDEVRLWFPFAGLLGIAVFAPVPARKT